MAAVSLRRHKLVRILLETIFQAVVEIDPKTFNERLHSKIVLNFAENNLSM